MPVAADSERKNPVVFVVDDDPSVREALSSLLRAVGWQVKTFESAAESLAQPVPVGAACLVLDVRLPDVSGLELQRVLAERGDGRRSSSSPVTATSR